MARLRKNAGGRNHRQSRSTGIPCAMALRLIRGLPGAPGFLATIPSAIALRQVDTSIGVSGHHDFAVRIMLFVGATDHAAAPHAHRSPGSTFVTIAIRPSHEPGMVGNIGLICPTAQVFSLRQTGTTGIFGF
ncbi:hypothetical protein [Bradyrhizobium oligotrophicum]|uniref:hypothetical protein n=1 Tax=Bradyrhizobium oligotrophicum TaxID=44255 RepID=UPI001360B2C4|nr:hypothetical protein [Bradyrhizobium oligotrophicum]